MQIPRPFALLGLGMTTGKGPYDSSRGVKVMGSGAVEIRRCQHIKVNGTQCGSPARRNEKYCHYHRENQPERVQVADEKGQASGEVLMPVLEDAQSIQTVVRQVAMLILGGKIDNKKAGLMLYALQIASANLKRMEAEKPRAAQVVVDPETVGETPMGMTPWSVKESGHEVEDEAVGFQGEIAAKLKQEVRAVRERFESHQRDAQKIGQQMKSEVEHTPKTDGERLRWLLNLYADQVGKGLGRGEWM
jgi:hypothetical protein